MFSDYSDFDEEEVVNLDYVDMEDSSTEEEEGEEEIDFDMNYAFIE